MRTIFLLLAALLLAACDQSTETRDVAETNQKAPSNEAHLKEASIDWYAGSIEEAFAESKASGKPVFLYWGAVWCPPCQEIKYTVFKSQQFINLTKLFIPVYLDGDTDRAQSWGEKFDVQGYPTMIVFNTDGDEVTRIPGGIDISRYNSVLELSLNQMKPTAELVQLALSDTSALGDKDFYQLAYYSWGQDSSAVPEDTDKAALFYNLSQAAPKGELASRFYMNYVMQVYRANKPAKEGEEVELPIQDGDDLVAGIEAILDSDELTIACWDSIAYTADDVLKLPTLSDEEKAGLGAKWSEQVFSLRNHGALSKAEKLAGWLPRLYFETLDDQPLADESRELLIAEMTVVDKATPDSYERQSVINQMSYIYRNGGLKDVARDLLLAELKKSASPYYFMSGLASFAERDEKHEEAIEWRRKAYENATGEATRFQWGANYVRTVIRLAPEDTETITGSSLALLAEFHESDEMFAGRNFKILKRLNQSLADWQKAQMVDSFEFAGKLESLCAEQVSDSIEQSNCLSLFEAPVTKNEEVAQAT